MVNRKVTDSQVLEIRERFEEGDSVIALARDFGLTRQSIYNIIKGTSWAYVLPHQKVLGSPPE